jgi:hypothetical protein
MKTNVVAELIQGDSQESSMLKGSLSELLAADEYVDLEGKAPPIPAPGLLSWHKITLGEVGYKSDKCPAHMNWDLHCMQSDLIFLELVGDDGQND